MGVTSTEIYVIKPLKNVNKYYLLWLLRRSKDVLERVKYLASTGTSGRQSITIDRLHKLKVPDLHSKVQEEIGKKMEVAVKSRYIAKDAMKELDLPNIKS